MISRLNLLLPLRSKRYGIPFRRFKSGWVDGGDHATMNDLPVPEGNWKEYHTRRNMVNNSVLISGIVALIAALSVTFTSGVINFNYLPPEHYETDDADCECEAHGKK